MVHINFFGYYEFSPQFDSCHPNLPFCWPKSSGTPTLGETISPIIYRLNQSEDTSIIKDREIKKNSRGNY